MKFLTITVLFVLLALVLSGGYQQAPSIHDKTNDLFNKRDHAAKYSNDMNNEKQKALDYLNQGYLNKMKKDYQDFKLAKNVKNNKNIMKSLDNINQAQAGRSRDNLDLRRNRINFNRGNKNFKQAMRNKRFNNSHDNIDQNAINQFNQSSRKKRSNNADTGNSFANHADYGNNSNFDQSKYGGDHASKDNEGQTHDFGNSYSDNNDNSMDSNNVNAFQQQNYRKRKGNNNMIDSYGNKQFNQGNTNFNQDNIGLRKRKGNQFFKKNRQDRNKMRMNRNSMDQLRKQGGRNAYEKLNAMKNQKFKNFEALKGANSQFKIGSYDHKIVGRNTSHKKE